MTDKDPKDMTVSELLRWSANYTMFYHWGNPWNKLAIAILGLDPEKARAQEVHITDAFSRLADKIDAELAQARELSLRAGAELWAKANGWPDFREGEDFGAWLERCAIPRPRFEDGEPVQIGDKAEHPYTGETCTIDCINTFDGSYCLGFVEGSSASLLDRERVKRPAPEVLGADGKPIKVGETVWGILSGIEGTVSSLNDDSTAYVEWDDERWSPCIDCCNLTHTPPDTQERIDEDARKDQFEYWQCLEYECCGCPIEIEGMNPKKRYECNDCCSAMALDLLRRQRELDKRTGGAE